MTVCRVRVRKRRDYDLSPCVFNEKLLGYYHGLFLKILSEGGSSIEDAVPSRKGTNFPTSVGDRKFFFFFARLLHEKLHFYGLESTHSRNPLPFTIICSERH